MSPFRRSVILDINSWNNWNNNHWWTLNITAMSNDRHGVSNCWSIECLFNRFFFQTSNKVTSKVCAVTGPLWGNPPVTGGFPSQRASNAEMFSFDEVIMEIRICSFTAVQRNASLRICTRFWNSFGFGYVITSKRFLWPIWYFVSC